MARLIVGAFEIGETVEIGLGEFLDLTLGRTITTAGDWGPDRFEFGLSGDVMLRILREADGLVLNVISTLNKGETPTLLLRFPTDETRLLVADVEKRLRALRQLYAIVYLSDHGRLREVDAALADGEQADLETLLQPDERLRIESIGRGSWLLTLWTKAKGGYKSLLTVVGTVYSRGREAFLSKLEADAKLKQIKVEREQFRLLKSKVDYSLALAEKLPPGQARDRFRERVGREVAYLLGDDGEDAQEASARLLGPSPRKKR